MIASVALSLAVGVGGQLDLSKCAQRKSEELRSSAYASSVGISAMIGGLVGGAATAGLYVAAEGGPGFSYTPFIIAGIASIAATAGGATGLWIGSTSAESARKLSCGGTEPVPDEDGWIRRNP